MDSGSAPPMARFESLIHHLVLPPGLPGKQESRLDMIERDLTNRMLNATRTLSKVVGIDQYQNWDRTRHVLQVVKDLNARGMLNKASLLTEFRRLGANSFLILHVAEQNAGLLIRRREEPGKDVVIFEAFEASPLSEKVLAAKNALQWDFPDFAVAVPYSEFIISAFQDALADLLERASTESIKRFAAHTNKAGSFAYESRETVDPSLITHMLMALLEAMGHQVDRFIVRKHVRDEVSWADGAEKPWRRCAYWLVLRVGFRRHLCENHGEELGKVQYKFVLCVLFAVALADAIGNVETDLIIALRVKLARRLAKLAIEKGKASLPLRPFYDRFFEDFGEEFQKTLTRALASVEATWNKFKYATQRKIQRLRPQATNSDFRLSLPNSGSYLQDVLNWHLRMTIEASALAFHGITNNMNVIQAANAKFSAFAGVYFGLSNHEAIMEQCTLRAPTKENEQHCIKLAHEISSYIDAVKNAYECDALQKSSMLLTVMGLWVSLDECACELYSLITEFDPGFLPEMLDVLQLPWFKDMCRLQRIQDYIRGRKTKSVSRKTIFSAPGEGCFALRFFEESEKSSELQGVLQRIEADAERTRKAKEEEWTSTNARFEKLQREMAESKCVYVSEGKENCLKHDDRRCRRCYLGRVARRTKIKVHEYPLPAEMVQKKVAVFELQCPTAFSAYRNITWRIMAGLASAKQVDVFKPCVLLHEYSGLGSFTKQAASPGVCLASSTKSFLSTHYREIRFPVSLERVCVPNGLKLEYYDTVTGSRLAKVSQKFTFAHHCEIQIPEGSPFELLKPKIRAFVESDGPSSYEIIASQTKCPSALNEHEYMTFQSLLSKKSRRWLSILTELTSSNLNLSSEATTLLISQLAIQAGPAHHDADALRTAHTVFRDIEFCKSLIAQVNAHLDTLSSNWREIAHMDMLLTLILRLCSLAPAAAVIDSMSILKKARATAMRWVRQLRSEIHRSTSVETALRCSKYAFWAALLCRKTFRIYSTDDNHLAQFDNIDPAALEYFLECSIALQDHIGCGPEDLSLSAKSLLIQDLKMVYRMRFILQKSLAANPTSLKNTINNVWPCPEGVVARQFSQPIFCQPPNEWWICLMTTPTKQTRQQNLAYHLLEGHLLVDGKPLAKLPAEHRQSPLLERLFGKQNLLTYPSSLYGMNHTLAFPIRGHEIHFGFRNNSLIVQARARGTLLELIPHHVFGNQSNFDVPDPLAANCVHWLDLETGILEIRQKPDIWISKTSNWLLNFRLHRAQRRNSFLVDPHSRTFNQVARIFEQFEHRHQLTVYQSSKSTLCVELRRLELSFFVNPKNGLLYCRQLRSEVDPNQDAGTWYGLVSKLVLRNAINERQRIVLVPMGLVAFKRDRFHVTVRVENDGLYGKFTINDTLGRLECPPEPRLVYLKAYLHAITSYMLNDTLTGRTGTEEALHCLQSGYFQPWTVLTSPAAVDTLSRISRLSPTRKYYPEGTKKMQQTDWNSRLTVTVQDDELRYAVERIRQKLECLSTFSAAQPQLPAIDVPGESHHLSHRSLIQRRLFQRSISDSDDQEREKITPYISRGSLQNEHSRIKIFEAASLIHQWLPEVLQIPDLAGLLESWSNIGGFDRTFDRVHISGLLEIDLALDWGSIVNKCRLSGAQETYELMFMFAILSFSLNVDTSHIRTLLSFALVEDLKSIPPPTWPSYSSFQYRAAPDMVRFIRLIKDSCVPYPGDEREFLRGKMDPSVRRELKQKQQEHEQQAQNDMRTFVQSVLEQWPCRDILVKKFPKPLLLDISRAIEIIQSEWSRLLQNQDLSDYIEKVQQVLDCCVTRAKILPPPLRGGIEHHSLTRRPSSGLNRTLSDLVSRPGLRDEISQPFVPSILMGSYNNRRGEFEAAFGPRKNVQSRSHNRHDSGDPAMGISPSIKELESIFANLISASSIVKAEYGRYMMNSLNALKVIQKVSDEDEEPFEQLEIDQEICRAKQQVQVKFEQLNIAFQQGDEAALWLQRGSLWPCITPIALLERLRSKSATVFGSGMKESLLEYGVSITQLQRLLRIQDAQTKRQKSRLLEEQKNFGHDTWQPIDYPDWLLMEIDANILIRPEQVEVALATIRPPLKSNSVLQMNMGQGKTSCIMPMAAAVLADTQKLLRVIVPQSLLLQTAQMLQSRIGGLVGREIRHVPFSRRTSTDNHIISRYLDLHKTIRDCSGVMVALPEHILSFKLSGLQRLSDGRVREAAQMIEVEAHLQQWSRDVLDESDFTLAVRTQLVYPSGSQTTVDGHPHRWEAAEALLGLVHAHLWDLQREFPQSIEIVQRPLGGFPLVFFLRSDVERELVARLVNDIACGQSSILPARDHDAADRRIIEQFISEDCPSPAVGGRIEQIFAEKPAENQVVHLIRGLLVHKILLLTLKKRWNVEYGLHPTRDPIAVPYHAKGVPSEQAEWGHPDVAILFTCLSFYFGGLALSQLRESLEQMVKSDDPASEYDRWTCNANNLSPPLRLWNTINVDDEVQLSEIWNHLRYNTTVIDYFLNKFVFPRHAKQFQIKMQASGWDIPLYSPANTTAAGQALRSGALTSGFSGTNDNRTLLPLTIKQDDLPALSHTSAEVLTYLLQPRSRGYILAADSRGRHFSEHQLLVTLCRRKIRMLIDAGAQILEMDNIGLAKAWLTEDHEALAAVFFNAENKLMVLYRNGVQAPLVATPFAENLENCLVYLDEAHTRGTDLKMPLRAIGALTLGLGQTKDHTVQAAMRLRQLATSQSIVFVAPPEVQQSILDLRKKSFGDTIDSFDVICWLLEQTCDGLEQMQPLFYAQGVDYCRRTQAAFDNLEFLTNAKQRERYLRALREREKQTLEQLYKPRVASISSGINKKLVPQLAAFMKVLESRQKAYKTFGEAIQSSALQEVEQEREVAFEVEAIREVQKPVHYDALVFPGLHEDIVGFIKTRGQLPVAGAGYEHWMAVLERTEVGTKYAIQNSSTRSRLFVSIEFSRTVRRPNDNFMRPANWILWSEISETALIIIPEEADLVLPMLRQMRGHFVHLLTYAAPITKKMVHFNSLRFYTVPAMPRGWKAPSWLTIELGIFAGRLYFDFEEYEALHVSLGLGSSKAENAGNQDAPTVPSTEADRRPIFKSTVKVLPFLQEWLAIRRRGQDFSHTPMGFVCQDKRLTAEHRFFKSADIAHPPVESNDGNAGDRSGGRDNQGSELEEEVGEEDYDGFSFEEYGIDDYGGGLEYAGADDYGDFEEEEEGAEECLAWLGGSV